MHGLGEAVGLVLVLDIATPAEYRSLSLNLEKPFLLFDLPLTLDLHCSYAASVIVLEKDPHMPASPCSL